MTTSVIAELDCTDDVRKRAQWEAFDFRLLEDSRIEVSNHSYADDEVAEHTYIVVVEEGRPAGCSCPAAEHYDGNCKHQLAVAMRQPLLDAVAAEEGGDGGLLEVDPDTCPNGETRCDGPDGDSFPCFACYCDSEKAGEV